MIYAAFACGFMVGVGLAILLVVWFYNHPIGPKF